MGKGGCFFDFLSSGLHVIRRVMGCICLFFIIGPVLIIVGITMLAVTNNRTANVNTFNNAVANFSYVAGVINRGTATDISSANINFIVKNDQVYISGNTDDVVANRTTVYYSSPQSNVRYGDIIQLVGNGIRTNVTVPPIPIPHSGSASKSCSSRSICVSWCNNAAPSGCMGNLNYCGFTSCQSTCTWNLYPSRTMCVQMSWSNTSGWQSTSNYCDYPFTTPSYSCQVNYGVTEVTFQLRSTNDPYVILQSLTKGSNDFGFTAAQQRNTGLALIGIGSCFFALSIFSCIFIKKACTQPEHKARVYEAFNLEYEYPTGYVPSPTLLALRQQKYPPQQGAGYEQGYAHLQNPPQQPYAAAPQPGYQQNPPENTYNKGLY